MDESRKHDLKIIDNGLRSSNPTVRSEARKAGEKIRSQSHDGWLRNAREKLIKEVRHGRKDNSTDIRDDIVKHNNMGIGKTSFHFDLSGIEGYDK